MPIPPAEIAVIACQALFGIGLVACCCCSRESEPEPVDGGRRAPGTAAARWAPAAPTTAPAVQRPPPPPAVTTLPYFPFAQGRASERLVCAICLELLRHGELCSEVPACRHLFHKECADVWTRRSNSCPLCRVKIASGPTRSNGGPSADDSRNR